MELAEHNRLLVYDLQFFAKEGPGGEKTEPATAKKLSDARKEGQVCKSKELDQAATLVALFLTLKVLVSFMGNNFLQIFHDIYNKIPETVSAREINGVVVMSYLQQAVFSSVKLAGPFFAVGVAVAFLINIVQVKWQVSTKPLKPKPDKFNPINGFKRMFSKDSLFELVKSIAKIALITLIAYTALKSHIEEIFLLYHVTLQQAIAEIGTLVIDVGFRISIIYCIIGAVDYIYQKHKFNEDMKMTKQEVKDEMKNSEGDPQIKSKQRQRMQEASRRRMMQDVPQADVVITNPTHYAVALKYDAGTGTAPVLVAKGADLIAQRIKEIAKENHVEIVENKPLARMIYTNVEIGHEIPPELYQAVAEILAAVYRAQNRV
ncbi:MAG: flagellar biosynthesis protein FlhB [Lachnospiraceae bacterium]|nr:flagellar biosynthesis protein FlhB [Lachnospiraceae bacterium]MDD7178633.1 flagellar biosynthesis protein FlhB [bacterium]MDY5518438.1 flagellar biosynthesis protein FlhB [Lachnospiraceae bacterium]